MGPRILLIDNFSFSLLLIFLDWNYVYTKMSCNWSNVSFLTLSIWQNHSMWLVQLQTCADVLQNNANTIILQQLGTVRICRLLPEHLPGRPNYDQEWSIVHMWSSRLWCMMFDSKSKGYCNQMMARWGIIINFNWN